MHSSYLINYYQYYKDNNSHQINLQHKFINNKQGSGTEPLDKVNNVLMNNISLNNNSINNYLPSSNLEKVITSGATITHKTLWFYGLVSSMLKLQKLHMKHTVFEQNISYEAQTLEASSFRPR